MVAFASFRHVVAAIALLIAGGSVLAAQPTVVAAGEGQIGKTPPQPLFDRVHPPDFAPVTIPGSPILEGDVALARIFQAGGFMPPSPELVLVEDRFHSGIFPAILRDAVTSDFAQVDKAAPSVEPWLSEDDFVALAFARDGSSSGTMTVEIAAYDFQNELKILDLELPDIATLPVPDELFSKTDLAVDAQGRITVVFTEVPSGASAKVRAQRVDAGLGTLGDLFDVNLDATDAEVALLDPLGNRLVVPSIPTNTGAADFGKIQANFLDLSGPTPVVEPEITVSTTPAPFSNINVRPAVAADPVTGAFTVCWDFVTGISGDPADIRARRYDPEGLPEGDDFQVNVPPLLGDDGAQGQCDAAYGPGGLSVIVWAADGATGDPDLDVFGRVFLPDGSPIVDPSFPLLAGQFRVNTGNTPGGPLGDRQDRPKVRFLPEPDASGRPQFAVVWRDVGDGDGSDPNGTGTTARCFSIDGLEEVPIFEDGFESGDTSSWSTTTP